MMPCHQLIEMPRPAAKRPRVGSGVARSRRAAASSVSTWRRPWPRATKATLVRSMGAHQPRNDTGEFVRRGFLEFPKKGINYIPPIGQAVNQNELPCYQMKFWPVNNLPKKLFKAQPDIYQAV